MKSWKEAPHLFCNGKFRIKYLQWIFSFDGVMRYEDGEWWVLKDSEFSYEIDKCTLIARPIEDMTDEELEKVLETDCYSSEYAREILTERANRGSLLGYHERNMANIGVYFGPQSYFNLPDDDPKKVIDSRTLEES